MAGNNSFVCNITPEQAETIRQIALTRGWELTQAPYTIFKVSGDHLSIAAYTSGKLVVQGKNTGDFVLYTLEPEVLHTFTYGYESTGSGDAAAEPDEEISHHGGIDESGKGDFFGPLVIAGVCVDQESGAKLRALGVCDSKLIHSPAKITKLALEIRKIAIERYSVVTIMPETYNRLYNNIGNLNRLLAWGHARVIENLLEKDPECPTMISDKFGSEHLIKNALMERGRKITLQQHVRAESDVAVAAASILARDGFLRGMAKLAELCGRELPKGAGPQIKITGAGLLAEKGEDIFPKCAKMHFKTAAEILQSK